MVNLNVNSESVMPPILEPPSPSSAQDFPDVLFSSNMKSMLPPSETDLDESLVFKGQSPLHKTVRFSPNASVEATISRHDMSIEERCNYWIQGHEFETIRQRNKTRNQVTEESHGSDENIQNSKQGMHRFEDIIDNPDEEIELRKDKRRPRVNRGSTIEEDFYEQSNVYYSDIFEDDAFAGIYFAAESER